MALELELRIEKLQQDSPALFELAKWFHAEWGHYHPGQELEGRVADTKKLCNHDKLPTTWVAYRGEELVGSVALTYDDLPTRPALNPWLASFYIKKELRGAGIGSKLFQYVMEEAPRMGIKDLYLYTHDRETMYARFGWKVMERTNFCGDDIAVMHYRFE
ncbi:MAG: GNAT family N-acetyltransferase [Oligoflexia bacterium]|nr:GNAT family N-acetyltransferase [Oligoflexia bacterium]